MSRHIFQSHYTDGTGKVVGGGTVSVVLAGTSTVATIYAASSGGSAISGGTVTTDADSGLFTFYVDDSDYASDQLFDITLSKTGFNSQTYSYIQIIGNILAIANVFTANQEIQKSNPVLILDATTGDSNIQFHVGGVVTGAIKHMISNNTIVLRDAVAGVDRFVFDLDNGNMTEVGSIGIGGAAFGASAVSVLSVASGTAPTTGPANTVQFYSSDDAAGHTIPSFYCEGTNVIATGQADSVSSVRVKMRINGTVVTLLGI